MLLHPTLDKLRSLKLMGMARALEQQQAQRDIDSLSFEERLGLLLDQEHTVRDSKMLAARLSRAKLKLAATPEDVDFKAVRGLDKSAFMALLDTRWVTAHCNILITGPTGSSSLPLPNPYQEKCNAKGYPSSWITLFVTSATDGHDTGLTVRIDLKARWRTGFIPALLMNRWDYLTICL